MSQIKINGKEFNDVQLVKLQKGKTDEAIGKLNSGKQGADDVVFKVGSDVFVASGRGLLEGKKTANKPFMGGEGVTVELDGKKGEVVAWDNQANSGKECAKWAATQLIIPVGGLSLLAIVALPASLLSLPVVAAVVLVPYAAGIVGAYVYGNSRKMQLNEVAEVGTVVQQNSQSQGGWGDALKNLFGKK